MRKTAARLVFQAPQDSRQAESETRPSEPSPAEASTQQAEYSADTELVPPAGADSRQAESVVKPIAVPPAEASTQQAISHAVTERRPPAGASTPEAEKVGPTKRVSLRGLYPRPAVTIATPVSQPPGASTPRKAKTGTKPTATLPSGGKPRRPAKVNSEPEKSALGGGQTPGPGAQHASEPRFGTLLDPVLGMAAEVVDDLEKARIGAGNRIATLTRSEPDADGVMRGFGLSEAHPGVMPLVGVLLALQELEKEAVGNLQKAMRRHPLGPWMAAQKGVGAKQGARLLAAIGDPYINSATGLPRTVSALWAYSGLHVVPASQSTPDNQPASADGDPSPPEGHVHLDTPLVSALGGENFPGDQPQPDTHFRNVPGDQTQTGSQLGIVPGEQRPAEVVTEPDNASPDPAGGDPDHAVPETQSETVGVAPRRRRGVKANWSGDAKMRAHLVAESCVKQLRKPCAPNAHVEDCQCSPYRRKYEERRRHTAVTHPEWTDGHSHNDGLRITSKEILKQLWRAARAWHLEQDPDRVAPTVSARTGHDGHPDNEAERGYDIFHSMCDVANPCSPECLGTGYELA